MDIEGGSSHPSQNLIDLTRNTVNHGLDNSPPGPEYSAKKKPGRPPGSRNKAKPAMPSTDGLELRNRTVSLSRDEVNEIRDYENYIPGDHDISDSDSEFRFETEAASLHRECYRKGVRNMTQLLEKKGPFTRSMVESHHPFSSSPTRRHAIVWNQAREEQLNASWESSLEKAALERPSASVPNLLGAWKLSLQLFGIDPLSLVSMYRNMEFDNSASDCFEYRGEMKRNPLWTEHFRSKLKRIMVHPFFNKDNGYRFIPIVIRWAVVCRVDDGQGFTEEEQRFLDHHHCGDLRPSVSPDSMVERFLDYQRKSKGGGLGMSRLAELMSHIADYSGIVESRPLVSIASIKIRDLTVVVKALDNLDCDTANIPCETHFLVYSDSKKARGYPVGVRELLDAYKRSWITLQRRGSSDYTEVSNEGVLHDRVPREPSIEEPTGRTAEEVQRSSRSPSTSEDGEVQDGGVVTRFSPLDDEHMHESRRALIRGQHDNEVIPAASHIEGEYSLQSRSFSMSCYDSFEGLPFAELQTSQDVSSAQPSDNGSSQDSHLSRSVFPISAPGEGHTLVRTTGPPAVLPTSRDSSQSCLGLNENITNNTTSGFLNVDDLVSGDSSRTTNIEAHPIPRRPASSNRSGLPASLPSRPVTLPSRPGILPSHSASLPPRPQKRVSEKSQGGKPTKRQNTNGGGMNAVERYLAYQKRITGEKSRPLRRRNLRPNDLQPPTGPRAGRDERAQGRK